ncbi:dynamin family protein [Fuchsiella alkaliacetigena]|nr:dynamin family protein [Fuchsiella alkaliacetigena]
MLLAELNRDQFKISFYGRYVDFVDLEEVSNYHNQNYNKNIVVEHIPIEGDSEIDKIDQLKELAAYMQGSPFEDLRSSDLQKKFEKAINSQFEVAVIATMSAGKSTLINALLGQELMPTENRACTATIVKLKDNDEASSFKGKIFDNDDNLLEEISNVDLEKMRKLNEDEKVDYIELEGDIPLISSEKTSLEIIDTPGPNSSNNPEHKKKTYRVIKKEAKPVVLYILDANNLGTNDDANLLKAVAEQMSRDDKQSTDRFIFALNKIDMIDVGRGGRTSDYIRDAKEHLKNHGIDNPNIYPISAELAKLIRMKFNGAELTFMQERNLALSDYFNGEEDKHLINYAPLSNLRKEDLYEKINSAKKKEDAYLEALYHSGIPSIEVAINEYLDKYTLPLNIQDAINPILKIIKAKQWKDELQNKINENDSLREKIIKKIDMINEEINKGEKARELRDKIDDFNISEVEINERIEETTIKIEERITDIRDKFKNKGDIKTSEANIIVKKLKEKISDLEADIYTDLETMREEILIEESNKLIKGYKEHLEDLIQLDEDEIEFQWNDLDYFTVNLPANNELVSSYKREREVKREPIGIWEKVRSFLGKQYFGKEEIVSLTNLLDEFENEVTDQFLKNINKTKEIYLKEEVESLKNYFLDLIDKLDQTINNKLEKINDLSKDKEEIIHKIKEDKKKVEWLNDFSNKVNSILEI